MSGEARLQECPNLPEHRLRPAASNDVRAIHELLEELPELYPGADLWLSRTLVLWGEGRVRITVAEAEDEVMGLAIVKRKAADREKLSTLFVDARWRGVGVGSRLLCDVVDGWRKRRVGTAIVTCRQELSSQFSPLFGRHGFQIVGCEHDRYGIGTREVVYEWSRERSQPDHDSVAPTLLRIPHLFRLQGV